MPEAQPRIAFLGLGLMGSRQVRRLLGAGYDVTVWNRTRAKAEPLAAHGATVADTAAGAVADADIVITMLENGPVVTDLLTAQGVAEAMRPGAVLIDMSSIKPAEARGHARMLAERGVSHLDAPVSGGTVGAEQGTLAIMAGGREEDYVQVVPVLEAMGKPTLVGPSGAGQYAKLANQVIVGVTIAAVAEALLLAERGGADPAKVREALRGGFAESRVLDLHGSRMVEKAFETKGRSVTHLKDMDNALAAAADTGFEAPLTAQVADMFRDLLAVEGDLDHSALYKVLDRRSPPRG
jgi:3-hydroxyisobutyrate dehydrogenase-like beta-hydroxyacid dehydrogenase